jgi:beta-glucosidase/6-phospho-beta-glucosidase/beta-galactosidase
VRHSFIYILLISRSAQINKIMRASYGLGMGQLCERYMLCVGLVFAACQLASGSVLDENFPITTAIPTTVLNGTFPVTFSWGTSTASYQVEGGWLDGGKGLSTWDSFSHTPGMIANGDTGDVANDMYHLYPADIELMKAQGLQHYRFSISWARIMPSGVGPVNQAGIDYYNDLINLLIKNGIEPHVTIYHNDMPLALTFYPYMSNPMLDGERFPIWFTDYAQVLFENFGDRVSNWFTFNEPWCFSVLGIDGDRDPYTIAHTSIIAHARVVDLYRSQYLQRSPADKKGTIGIVLNTAHFYPLTADSQLDQVAADRAYDFQYDWFLGPMVRGEYPQSMRETLGDRLPSFTDEEVRLVKGSLDFVAINYYFPYMTTAGGWSADDAGEFSLLCITPFLSHMCILLTILFH